MKHEFDTQLLITVAGVEEEYDIHVIGEYHRAQEAFTYPGEYAPTDSPEPASFEAGEVTVDYLPAQKILPSRNKPSELSTRNVSIRNFLSTKQIEAIEDEGLRDAQENG